MADAGDRMFCHACGGVWLHNAGDMTCPHCESDFTEIVRLSRSPSQQTSNQRHQIEIPPDPDADPLPERPPSAPAPARARPNPWADHNPWAHQEEDDDLDHGWGTGNENGSGNGDGNGFTHRTFRSPDGRFTFSTTTYTHGFPRRSPPSQRPANDPLMPMVQGLDSIFNGLANTYRQQNPPGSTSSQPHTPDRDRGRTLGSFEFDIEADGRGQDDGLHPRNADGPQPLNNPLRTLSDILELFRSDFGTNTQAGGSGVRVVTGPNPLGMLSTLLNFDRRGDIVYSQEELDRVIEQLIEQTATRGAPPPAPATAIQSLPKKKVDAEMLGSEGRAECSICMDTVELGTEVTMLPCKHWFHYNCIELWLNQHNTCPHCRRSIDASQSEIRSEARPETRPEEPEGTRNNPTIIPDSPEPAPQHSNSGEPSQSQSRPRGGQSPSGWSTWSSSWSGSEEPRRSSRGEGSGGVTGWLRSRLGGGSS
ncbi:hypothetical protein BO94DRAFT_594138 [Aspergillus sclerotioniger CBS 115572]|uniref:RING-type E3 ubiquitin transferase n=1 Tax=Aspergillus sclerotioniger CBS 115572 TaxID=1450535 RepID=A0A317WZ76_9EURO|nr:hypothetical protein BO94DRAFT_594138 [Aspergillus sclerotioniger CBS 115572]PWY89530.1 hypothetical protein BO94DRAFT_594138 [Aspergillus sclerotioniger CBS 115572]